jgi:hypothetical protein
MRKLRKARDLKKARKRISGRNLSRKRIRISVRGRRKRIVSRIIKKHLV